MRKKIEENINRREFTKTLAAGIMASSIILPKSSFAADNKPSLTLPPLPYAPNALEPYLSAQTVDLHYNKHHKGYYDMISKQVKGSAYAKSPLSEIILKAHGSVEGVEEATFFMAVLAWNHDLYWKSMKPQGGGKPGDKLAKMITKSFGSFDKFKKVFKEKAMDIGIGWVWLAYDGTELTITRTTYHDTALLQKLAPLLTIDMWEHAYYMDYKDEKEKYVDAFLGNLVNWTFAEDKLDLYLKSKK